ncbi:MAG: hypothetical protein ABFD82_02100 [Syntrophaceae bacterium]
MPLDQGADLAPVQKVNITEGALASCTVLGGKVAPAITVVDQV